MLEWAERDPQARAVVHAALGRFATELGGLGGCMAQAGRETLEEAFTVPGRPGSRSSASAGRSGGGSPTRSAGRARCSISAAATARARSRTCGRAGRWWAWTRTCSSSCCSAATRASTISTGWASPASTPPGFRCRSPAAASATWWPPASSTTTRACAAEASCAISSMRPRGVLEPGGGFAADRVPNRLHPFPSEVNVDTVIGEARLQRIAKGRDPEAAATDVAAGAGDRDRVVGGLPRLLRGTPPRGLGASRLPARGLEGGAGGGGRRAAADAARMADARPRLLRGSR